MDLLSAGSSLSLPVVVVNEAGDSDAALDTTTVFTSTKHTTDAFDALNQFRLNAQFLCDLELKIDNDVFACHRTVVAATIPYFRSMFQCNMRESSQKVVQLHDFDPTAFQALLNYAYTSTISINQDNVQKLLYTASILQFYEFLIKTGVVFLMDEVCCACEDYLTEYLSIANCLAIRQFAQQHHCTKLLTSIDNFTVTHFQELRTSAEFLQIPGEHLVDLLASDELHVSSEKEVVETVIAWVGLDADARKEHLPNLLSRVRLGQLPTQYLIDHVKANPLIRENSLCRDLVCEALEEQMLNNTDLLQANASSSAIYAPTPRRNNAKTGEHATLVRSTSRPRKSAAGVIFCVGGRGTTGDPFRSVEAFDWRTNKWVCVTEMQMKRRHVGVVAADGKLYAIGGHDGTDHLDSAECFDTASGVWKMVASMSTRRRGIAVGCLEHAIYAVGGLDDTTCFQTVERYDVEADRWSSVARMNVQRGGVGVAALRKYLYAVGGNDGTSSLDSCERYDPHLNKWTLVGSMAHRRAGAGVTVLNGSLYAIGGFDDNAPLASCERYCPVTDRWNMLPSMSCPRGGVGVAAMGGRIYAVGGHDGMHYLDSVEAYDPSSNEWECVARISQCRAGAGVAWCNCLADRLTQLRTDVQQPTHNGGGVAVCV